VLVARYRERFGPVGRGIGLSALDIVEADEGRGRRPEERKRDESARLLALVPAGYRMVALEPGSRSGTTEALAAEIGAARDGGVAGYAFLIGGPDGLDERLLAQVQGRLSFGAMTLPHQLVRVLLAEQLYRVATLLAGHPYHRG
jgi:23S rRNA (pseudouridine1915-N3)-methyltransferase